MPKRKSRSGDNALREKGSEQDTTLDEKYNGSDSTADVRMISSDMVEFRVHRYHLLSARWVKCRTWVTN